MNPRKRRTKSVLYYEAYSLGVTMQSDEFVTVLHGLRPFIKPQALRGFTDAFNWLKGDLQSAAIKRRSDKE